jgi:hypothetical protein
VKLGSASDYIRQFGIEFCDRRAVAFGPLQLRMPAEHAVEFVDEKRNSFVAFVGLDRGIHVGAVNLDVAFGLEARGDSFLGVAFQFHADAHDALLVTE